jgi:hypothetical protein
MGWAPVRSTGIQGLFHRVKGVEYRVLKSYIAESQFYLSIRLSVIPSLLRFLVVLVPLTTFP